MHLVWGQGVVGAILIFLTMGITENCEYLDGRIICTALTGLFD